MTISKEMFFEILDYLYHNDKLATDFHELLDNDNIKDKKNIDFIDPYFFIDTDLINYIIILLQNEFEDKDAWISYWIYELNYGQDWEPGMIHWGSKDIKLQTKEDLYNFLILNLETKYKRGTD